MKAKTKSRKGFTLMEVLVTVLIVGVLAAISYPVYKKSVTKARAVEAVNLIELVKNKQIQNFTQNGGYFDDFSNIDRLTLGKEEKSGAQLIVNEDYSLYLNAAKSCVSAYYKKGTPSEFSFSAGYEDDGLGCSGAVCSSFGNIIGDTKSVCNCGNKSCGNGYTLNEETCSCECLQGCESGGSCYAPYGGGQSRPCASGCGTQTSTSTCSGPSWSGACGSPSQTKPTSQKCGRANSGTQTRTCTADCNGGTCGAWGPCQGQTCDPASKPILSQKCGNCGTQSRTVTCNTNTGNWNTPSAWGTCINQGVCSPNATKECGGGNGKILCSNTCSWGTCQCNKDYVMVDGTCQPDCSIHSVKIANRDYCCASAPKTDNDCYKDCQKTGVKYITKHYVDRSTKKTVRGSSSQQYIRCSFARYNSYSGSGSNLPSDCSWGYFQTCDSIPFDSLSNNGQCFTSTCIDKASIRWAVSGSSPTSSYIEFNEVSYRCVTESSSYTYTDRCKI